MGFVDLPDPINAIIVLGTLLGAVLCPIMAFISGVASVRRGRKQIGMSGMLISIFGIVLVPAGVAIISLLTSIGVIPAIAPGM